MGLLSRILGLLSEHTAEKNAEDENVDAVKDEGIRKRLKERLTAMHSTPEENRADENMKDRKRAMQDAQAG